VPHNRATLALRHLRATTPADVHEVLAAVEPVSNQRVRDEFAALRNPAPADGTRPWQAGYDAALDLRDQLGWGDDPCPDIAGWLHQQGVGLEHPTLPPQVDVVANWSSGQRAGAALNAASVRHTRREMGAATALGHLLMDPESISIDGATEHWPTSARARAFGAMLMLPEDGLRAQVAGRALSAERVDAISRHYGAGVHATAWHLRNLGLLDDDLRVDILTELRPAAS